MHKRSPRTTNRAAEPRLMRAGATSVARAADHFAASVVSPLTSRYGSRRLNVL